MMSESREVNNKGDRQRGRNFTIGRADEVYSRWLSIEIVFLLTWTGNLSFPFLSQLAKYIQG